MNEIDRYISNFPAEVKIKLETIRNIIKNNAPEAEEIISYKMPAFKLKRILVYFAAHKNHIGFYPTGSGIEQFKNELSEYTFSKGAIQFPFSKEMPKELIAKIVRFRVNENRQK